MVSTGVLVEPDTGGIIGVAQPTGCKEHMRLFRHFYCPHEDPHPSSNTIITLGP